MDVAMAAAEWKETLNKRNVSPLGFVSVESSYQFLLVMARILRFRFDEIARVVFNPNALPTKIRWSFTRWSWFFYIAILVAFNKNNAPFLPYFHANEVFVKWRHRRLDGFDRTEMEQFFFISLFFTLDSLRHDANMKSFNCFSPKLNLIDNSNFIFYACANHLSFFFKFSLYSFVFASICGCHYAMYGFGYGERARASTEQVRKKKKNNAIMRFSFPSSSVDSSINVVVDVVIPGKFALLPANHFREQRNRTIVSYVRILSIIPGNRKGVL